MNAKERRAAKRAEKRLPPPAPAPSRYTDKAINFGSQYSDLGAVFKQVYPPDRIAQIIATFDRTPAGRLERVEQMLRDGWILPEQARTLFDVDASSYANWRGAMHLPQPTDYICVCGARFAARYTDQKPGWINVILANKKRLVLCPDCQGPVADLLTENGFLP